MLTRELLDSPASAAIARSHAAARQRTSSSRRGHPTPTRADPRPLDALDGQGGEAAAKYPRARSPRGFAPSCRRSRRRSSQRNERRRSACRSARSRNSPTICMRPASRAARSPSSRRAPQLDTGWVAVKFSARSPATRASPVALGAGDHAIREISYDPAAPGLAELIAGAVSFGDVITRDTASSLNLIAAGREADRGRASRRPGLRGFRRTGARLSARRHRCRRARRPRRRAR